MSVDYLIERLFTPTTEPVPTVTDRWFLRRAERQFGPIERAYIQLQTGVDNGDVEQVTIACRRFLAIGGELGDAARDAERGRA